MVLLVRGTKQFRERTYEFKTLKGLVEDKGDIIHLMEYPSIPLCSDMDWEIELERMEHIAARGRDAAEHFKAILAENY